MGSFTPINSDNLIFINNDNERQNVLVDGIDAQPNTKSSYSYSGNGQFKTSKYTIGDRLVFQSGFCVPENGYDVLPEAYNAQCESPGTSTEIIEHNCISTKKCDKIKNQPDFYYFNGSELQFFRRKDGSAADGLEGTVMTAVKEGSPTVSCGLSGNHLQPASAYSIIDTQGKSFPGAYKISQTMGNQSRVTTATPITNISPAEVDANGKAVISSSYFVMPDSFSEQTCYAVDKTPNQQMISYKACDKKPPLSCVELQPRVQKTNGSYTISLMDKNETIQTQPANTRIMWRAGALPDTSEGSLNSLPFKEF